LFAAFSIGKWTQQTCLRMVRKLAKVLKVPSLLCPLEVFTDGNDDHTYVLSLRFQLGLVDYGQLIKIKKNGKMVGKKKIIVYGGPSLGDIETTEVENFNSILRERLERLVRESKCFSKVKRSLVCAVELFKFYWNFINEFKRGFFSCKAWRFNRSFVVLARIFLLQTKHSIKHYNLSYNRTLPIFVILVIN